MDRNTAQVIAQVIGPLSRRIAELEARVMDLEHPKEPAKKALSEVESEHLRNEIAGYNDTV